MSWTKEIPKEKGYYWMKEEGREPIVIDVWISSHDGTVFGEKPGDDGGYNLALYDYEYWPEKLITPDYDDKKVLTSV